VRQWSWATAGLGLVAGLILRTTSPQPDLDARFAALINSRNDAMARGDTAAVHRGITDDMEWVIGATGASVKAGAFLSLISHVPDPRPEWTIDSVHVRDLGGVATVTYRRLDRRRAGDYEGTSLTRALEVYVKRGHEWRLVHHSHTWIVMSPSPITVDSVTLAPFVGHYRIGGSYVDDVHWQAHHLVATATGQSEGADLVPVSESAFSPDGVAPLIVFERDAKGHVIGYVQGLPDGRVVRARRID
jgi:ketosteroid isomerase-like protein